MLINAGSYGNFAGYGQSNSLHVHLADPESEVVYFGFSENSDSPGSDYYFRVVDTAGSIVYGPVLVNSTTENLTTHALAVLGPAPLAVGGYTPFTWDPSGVGNYAGDYTIEFSTSAAAATGAAIIVQWWDITVSNGAAINGRLWAKNWALSSESFANQYKGEMYVYTADQYVYSFDFDGSNFRPFYFNIFFNSTGPGSSGVIETDRQSVNASLSGSPDYKIFFNNPDVSAYPSGVPGSIGAITEIGCDAGNYCIEVEVTQTGEVQVLLDFDSGSGAGIYDPGTADILLNRSYDNVPLTKCVDWDGKDGLGVDVGVGSPVTAYVTFSRGISHFPVYDAEYNENGFNVSVVRPAPGPDATFSMYWDNTGIPDANGTGDPATELNGCAAGCNSWSNSDFGNENTINTWWGVQIDSVFSFVMPDYAVVDAGTSPDRCPLDTSILSGAVGLSGGGAWPHGVEWSTAGSGSFIDATALSPSYVPSSADSTAGNVKLYINPESCPDNTDSVTINFDVVLCNDPMTAVDDDSTTMEDVAVVIPVVDNDTDTDGSATGDSLAVVGAAVNGSVLVNTVAGTFTYTPDLNYNGLDSFRYRVCDDGFPVTCDSAWVRIAIFRGQRRTGCFRRPHYHERGWQSDGC